MVSEKNLASSIGGKTARACDSCIKKRARWYCPADDAFLCQTCDTSVHSANPLAQRHQRVHLKTVSDKHIVSLEPSWHRNFTRKARTPRRGKSIYPRASKSKLNTRPRTPTHHLVPDNENSYEESEEQEQPLLYHMVPVLEPFHGDHLCFWGNSNGCATNGSGQNNGNDDRKYKLGTVKTNDNIVTSSSFHEFYSTLSGSMHHHDPEEFAVDVESLLGKGLDCDDLETLGFLDCREKESMQSCSRSTAGRVKKEDEMEGGSMENMCNGDEVYMRKDTFDQLNLDDYGFQLNFEENNNCGIGANIVEGEKVKVVKEGEKKMKKILLALDYESVIAAWADQKSPWTNGDLPKLDLNDCWPDCLLPGRPEPSVRYHSGRAREGGTWSSGDNKMCWDNIGIGMKMVDGGREARVSRYREKRRTRLFSKKIRYEVRKLNADKRPRIKGRFVKRPNFLS